MDVLNKITFKLPFNSIFNLGNRVWEIDITDKGEDIALINIFQTNFPNSEDEQVFKIVEQDMPITQINMEFLMEVYSGAYLTYLKEMMNYYDTDNNSILDNSYFNIANLYPEHFKGNKKHSESNESDR